jgi:hypothetical protein
MFDPSDSPATGPPGDGKSFIKLDVSFRRAEPKSPAFVQVIIFHNEELENVHKAADSGRFCCTHRNQGSQYGCYVEGAFVTTYQPLLKLDLELPTNGSAVHLAETYAVEKTGLHYLMYSSCQPEAGNVFIDGHNVWMNPYGYLAGELYYNMPFFLALTIMHVIALIVWLGLILKYRDELLPVQGHIGGVIVLALLEVLLWYFHFNTFNTDGLRSMSLMVAAIIASTVKKTVSRLLVLVVCMGYGIVKPTLGDKSWQVVIFGVVYCVFSTVLDVVKALSHDTDVSGGFFVLVIIPVAVLDSVFYYWTFVSLYEVVAHLEERKQTVKMLLYRRFIWVLGACLVFSCGWVLYQMYFLYANLFPWQWQTAWLFDAYWYVLGFAILLAIMCLWAPNENSKRYAYYEENVNLDGDDGASIEMEHQDNSLVPAFDIGEDEEDIENPVCDAEAGEVESKAVPSSHAPTSAFDACERVPEDELTKFDETGSDSKLA